MGNQFFSSQQKSRTIDVTAVENALVDLLVKTSDAEVGRLGLNKGIMQLVDASAQGKVLSALGARPAEVELGGSAANALRGLATLGAQVSYSSLVGKDKYGESFARRLKELDIINRLVLSESPTGTCLVVVTDDGERTMNTHLGACREYRRDHVPVADIRNSKIFFTTGYCWDTPNQIDAVEFAISEARAAGTKIALDVADPFAVGRSKDAFNRLIDSNTISILFANAEEAQMLVGCRGEDAARKLGAKIEIAVVKDGSGGAYICADGVVSHIPVVPTKVIDTTGAGDMFAGGFLYGVISGYSADVCGKIGALLASDNISYLGVRLSPDIVERVKRITG